MQVSQTQNLWTDDNALRPFTWEIVSGGGTLEPATGAMVLYTAPASNPDCSLNPKIRLTNSCLAHSDLVLSIGSTLDLASVAYFTDASCRNMLAPTTACKGIIGARVDCPEGMLLCVPFLQVIENGYNCKGQLLGGGMCNRNYEVSKCTTGSCLASTCCSYLAKSGGCHNIFPGGIFDARTDAMKNDGCCPAALF
jgi:hypothetical protein